jgi:hypothetical protein
MSRKKLTKRSKRQKSNKSNKTVSVQKMEKEFLQTPSKLAAQLDKQVHANKKKQNKLAKAVSKINVKVNKTNAKVDSASGKMQVKAASKKRDAAVKMQTVLNNELQTVTNALDDLQATQAKFRALQKCLNQFNADWTKASKTTKVKAKAGKGRPKKLAPVEPMHQAEASMDHVAIDEVTELAS